VPDNGIRVGSCCFLLCVELQLRTFCDCPISICSEEQEVILTWAEFKHKMQNFTNAIDSHGISVGSKVTEFGISNYGLYSVPVCEVH
jgi:hypothetical protein